MHRSRINYKYSLLAEKYESIKEGEDEDLLAGVNYVADIAEKKEQLIDKIYSYIMDHHYFALAHPTQGNIDIRIRAENKLKIARNYNFTKARISDLVSRIPTDILGEEDAIVLLNLMQGSAMIEELLDDSVNLDTESLSPYCRIALNIIIDAILERKHFSYFEVSGKLFKAWEDARVADSPAQPGPVQENEEDEDLLAGVDRAAAAYTNIGKPADMFIVNISNDFDYEKDERSIPSNAIPIEWRSLPPGLLAAGKLEFIADDPPGIFYTAEEYGFVFYITEPLMKNILSDTFFSKYPKKYTLKVRDLLVTYEPCLQWIEANIWDD